MRLVRAPAEGLLVLVLAAFAAGCGPKSQIVRLGEPGGPMVVAERYPGWLTVLPAYHPIARRALAWQQDIESHEKVLRRTVREHFDAKNPLEFHYMYTGLDSVANAAVVRYFAHDADPVETAGWEVMLVYSLSLGRLILAHVAAVPLE